MTPICDGRSRRALRSSRIRRRWRRGFERLEDRSLLALFLVNSPLDTVDANLGDGIAQDATGQTTLRAAIMEANARAGDDTILLGPGTYALSLAGANDDAAARGDLDIVPNGRLIINGAGAGSTIIDAAGLGDRVFQVLAFANLSISGVTVRNGNVTGAPVEQPGDGGGFLNAGTLTITGSVVSDNMARDFGGGIANVADGSLTITDSTIAGNSAPTAAGISVGDGTVSLNRSTVSDNSAVPGSAGGIFNADGTLTIVHSTISGNRAALNGGGILNTGELTIRHSTIADNTAGMSGGGIHNTDSGTVTAQNSIFADNIVLGGIANPDFDGIADSLGNNLVGDTAGSSGWITSDLQNVDPLLGPLADNGGPTQTHALLTGSPAIDAGNNAGAPANDQRGAPFVRIFNSTVDIGAYESQSLSLFVDTTADENDGNYAAGDLSLREAVLLANRNPGRDTITGGGSITLALGELSITGDLAISGMALSGNNASRIFNIAPGVAMEISGQTIRNGRASDGGAILNGGTLTIAGSTIAGNAATNDGGGVYNEGGTLTISDSTISGNSATNAGGGLYNDGGTLTIDNSVITDNISTSETASIGGGIFNSGELAIVNSAVVNNAAAHRGGGIHNADSGALSILTSTLADNRAAGFVVGIQGGGLYNLGIVTISRSTISGNTASPEGSSGGGIYNQDGTLTLNNSTISGNSANQTGGIFNNAELTITHSTITANSTNMFVGPPSEGSGGIANSPSGSVTVRNTIIADNVAGTVGGTPDFFGAVNSLGNNLIGDTAGNSGWVASDVQDVDPQLGPLADNGGPTLTHALLPGSPAIDAGNNADAPPTDQRGEPFDRIANGTVDIGAYETQPLRFVVDIAIDENDGNYSAGDLSLREAILLTSDNPDHDIIEFAPVLTGATITLMMGELLIASDLTITGLGMDQLFISGNDASRVFQVAVGTTVSISDLTIRNGRALEGGGVLNMGNLSLDSVSASNNSGPQTFGANPKGGGIHNAGRLVMTNTTVSNNGKSVGPGGNGEGGGIWNSGELTLVSSTLVSNSIVGSGGGIYSTVTAKTSIRGSEIKDNRNEFTGSGGAIWNAGELSIEDTTISGNSTMGGASAIWNSGELSILRTTITRNRSIGETVVNSGQMLIEDSIVSRNTHLPSIRGGGIYNAVSGSAAVLRTTISENSGALHGGGIYSEGTLAIADSTISRNTADVVGGGIYGQSGMITITNSTVSGNSAHEAAGIYNNATMKILSSTVAANVTHTGGGNLSGVPGGVENSESGVLTIQNTIVAGNRLGGLFPLPGAGPDIQGRFNSLGHNIIGVNAGSSGWVAADQTGTLAMPLDPRLGPLADNGWKTMTHALLHGSPAVDAGNDSAAPLVDQRGVARPKDGGGDGTAVADIGAFELASAGEVPDIQGTSGDDTFLVRRSDTEVQVFANDAATGMPIFAAPIGSITSLVISTGSGDDRLIIDLVNGNPIPNGSIHFTGSHDNDGDSLVIRGDGSTAEYLPSGRFSGLVLIGGDEILFDEVELIDVSNFDSFTVVTPNFRDELFLRSVGVGISSLSGTSSLSLEALTFSDVRLFIIDAATNDIASISDDSLTIFEAGVVPSEIGFVHFLGGIGTNTLTVRSATARIDATVDAEGTLNTTLSDGAQLITHRLRQSSLTIGAGSEATILPDGTEYGASVLNSLIINPGGTLDVNDNALILDYTGDSSVATIRSKIVEGRGGVGIGQGKWTGTGITSSIARQVNATMPESRSVAYADNGALPLGPFSTFRGVPVDGTSILIAYTRTADANLDGVVGDADVTIVGATYAPGVPQPRWALGDFDFNGFVDDGDVTLLGALYDPTAEPFATPPPPEPMAADDDSLIDLLAVSIASELANQAEPRLMVVRTTGYLPTRPT